MSRPVSSGSPATEAVGGDDPLLLPTLPSVIPTATGDETKDRDPMSSRLQESDEPLADGATAAVDRTTMLQAGRPRAHLSWQILRRLPRPHKKMMGLRRRFHRGQSRPLVEKRKLCKSLPPG